MKPRHFALSTLVLFAFLGVVQAQEDKTALAKEAEAVLKANCYRCHGQEGSSEGGFNFVLDRERLVASRKVTAGDPARSAIYRRMKKGDMPPEDEKPRPSEADLETVRRWIEAGAPDPSPKAAARKRITTEEAWKLVQRDLELVGERDRRHIRYFTLTHLYNANWSDEELESYRLALSKLVNSLSWGKNVVKPRPIDPAKTILRIDLRDYKWSDTTWSRILSAYPYGVLDERLEAVKACTQATDCPLPLVRGDWFVSAASRPPLYHEVLQLPMTDHELERLLHIDVEENIKQERVARAGFNGSGVSQHNRLIERHETAFGAYWKSYDFAGSADRESLFAYPLGPGGQNAFMHSGGEIIFSLPNGLQAYLLVDEKGNRIDKGPTNIVSDPKQADRAVVNGLSCMSCHSKGIIEKTDQVRESVLKNPKAFTKEEADTILALYPEKRRMDRHYQEDAERYARAVAWTGGKLDRDGKLIGSDPVVNLALLFEREMDLNLAAAEIGVEVEILVKVLDRSPELARPLGVLRVQGGTLQRQTFVACFSDLVRELDIGVVITGKDVAGSAREIPGRLGSAGRLFSTGPVVFLADLQEFDVRSGQWPFTKDGSTGNNGQRIKVGGKPSPKGLGMHPPGNPNVASVKYRLGKQAAVFKTTVAVDDTANFCWTPAVFTVWGDGKELFKSKMIAHNHSRTQECTVDVSGVDELELRVQCIGHNRGVHAVWVEPRLFQRANAPDLAAQTGKLFGQGPRQYLSDLEEINPKVGEWNFGKDGDKGNGKRICVNGKPSPKGLGMHPPRHGHATVSYRINKQAAVFKGSVGLDDDCGQVWANASATFEILGDGKRLWSSRKISQPRATQDFTVNVSGVNVLELRVVCPGPHNGIHAVWIEPRLLRTAGTPDR